MILMAALLGAKNSVAPLMIVLGASALNAVGDWYLVVVRCMGVRGAGIATAAAEVLSMAFFLRAVGEYELVTFWHQLRMSARVHLVST